MATTPKPPAKIKPNFAPRMNNEVQSGLLKRFKAEATVLTVKLMDGSYEVGVIKDFDTFSIEFATDDGRKAIFYKHGIVGFITQLAKAAK
jgi:RNA chaperone Hfq